MNKYLGLDDRYLFSIEHTGRATSQNVVRFCGGWVGSSESKHGAALIALNHAAESCPKRSEWRLVAEARGVMWLSNGNKYRVISRARSVDFDYKDHFMAGAEFGRCLSLSLENDGFFDDDQRGGDCE